MPRPLTICVLTYDRPQYLEECVRSILDQTFEDYRLVILHNPGKKDYRSALSTFNDSRIVYVKHEKNIGIHANFQMAFQDFSDSKYLIVFHDDDIMHPGLVESEIDIMDRYDDVQFIASKPIEFTRSGDLSAQQHPQLSGALILENVSQLAIELLRGFRLHFGSTMYRSKALQNVNWLELEQMYSKIGDRALLLQLAAGGRCALLRSKMVFYRHHQGQDSASMWDREEHFINLYSRYRESCEPNWNMKTRCIFFRHTGFWLPWTYKKLDPRYRSSFPIFVGKCRKSGILCIPFMLFYLTWHFQIKLGHISKRLLGKNIYNRLTKLMIGVDQ